MDKSFTFTLKYEECSCTKLCILRNKYSNINLDVNSRLQILSKFALGSAQAKPTSQLPLKAPVVRGLPILRNEEVTIIAGYQQKVAI